MKTDKPGMRLTLCMITFYISIPNHNFFSLDGHKHKKLLSKYIFSIRLARFNQ